MAHLRRRSLSLTVILTVVLESFLAVGVVGAASPALVVTPDPITVHIGTTPSRFYPTPRVPFGTTVQVQVEAVGFAPAGNYFISIAGSYVPRPTCFAQAAVTVCSVPVPSLPYGTYTMTTRYQSNYARVGPVVTAYTTVIVAP